MKNFLFLLCTLALFERSSAQNTSTANISYNDGIKKLLTSGVTEKVYLHVDRSLYSAGDTAFFKAYVTIGDKIMLSKMSGILYVDLINSYHQRITSLKLQLVNGLAAGDMALPDTLSTGNYQIRAYTNYMINFLEPHIFEQKIVVGNTNRLRNISYKKSIDVPEIQFFPEGGELLENVKTKIAFKAVNKNGLGINVSGILVDQTGREITKFNSMYLGMGYFTLKPEKGFSYIARVKYSDGNSAEISLPIVVAKNMVLSANYDSLSKIVLMVNSSPQFFKEKKDRPITLEIYSGGITTTVKSQVVAESVRFDLQTRYLHSGICRITLRDEDNLPVSERLVFVQKNDQLKFNFAELKERYPKRAKVNLQIRVADILDKSVSGSFSLSVVDLAKVNIDEDGEHSILTNLLLTNELKGYVEKPNYYFKNSSEKVRNELDLVLLTHGYRRYTWKPGKDSTVSHKPEKFLDLAGIIYQKKSPYVNKSFSLIPKLSGPVLNGNTNELGRFMFDNLVFTDTTEFYIKPGSSKEVKNLEVQVADQSHLPALSNTLFNASDADYQILSTYLKNNQSLTNSAIGKQLAVVDIKGKRIIKAYRTLSYAGAGNASQTIQMKDIKGGGTLESILNGRLNHVTFLDGAPMTNTGGVGPRQMLVVVDGAIIPNIKGFPPPNVNNFQPGTIKTVEILTGANAAIYGMDAGAGVMIITSKQGDDLEEEKNIPESWPKVQVVGFYRAKEFYSPNYEHYDQNKVLTDSRKTIFWSPNLITNENGEVVTSFYNALTSGNYRLVIEGIDDKGNIGRKVVNYLVN